jgi:hypothetical protein
VVERDLYARATETLGRSAGEIRRILAALGKELGPPWRSEEKSASVVAWLALT